MSSHTKGPWAVDSKRRVFGPDIHGSRGSIRPFITHVSDNYDDQETEANACLIAAAPEMLLMLQRVIDLLNDPDADSFDANQLEREIERLISKAVGVQS